VSERVWPNSGFEEIVGKNLALSQVLAASKRLLSSDAAVLIAGERGSGKHLFGRAIYRVSSVCWGLSGDEDHAL
jgi:DNA-binding NtrC family response regulator